MATDMGVVDKVTSHFYTLQTTIGIFSKATKSHL